MDDMTPAESAVSGGAVLFNAADEDGYRLRVADMGRDQFRFVSSDPAADFMAVDLTRAEAHALIIAIATRLGE